MDMNKCNAMIKELGILSEIEYQHQRKNAAKTLKISVLILDKLVKNEKANILNTNVIDIFPHVEPWLDPVNIEALLDEIEYLINKFIIFPSIYQAKAIALWILFTHCIDATDIAPILFIKSPEKRCGKSTLLSYLHKLVKKPLIACNITGAAMFRSIAKYHPTLIIDEVDTFMRHNEELRGVINSGHYKTLAFILRCIDKTNDPVPFSTWCAKVFAGIRSLPDTIEDRSIIIELRRKLTSEITEKINDDKFVKQFDDLLRKCMRFSDDNLETIRSAKPYLPNFLSDRTADNWKTLFAIANLAGQKWTNFAERAASSLENTEVIPTVSIELLADMRNIFLTKKISYISTSELILELCKNPEARWSTFDNGRPITDRQLSDELKEFKVSSKNIRFNEQIKKGYKLKELEDTFKRYLLPVSLTSAN